jgi:alpha-mannosidase
MRVPEAATPSRRARGSSMATLPITTTLSLTATSRMVTFETTVDNTARDHRLRVLVPTGIATDTVTVDEHFTLVDRTTRHYDLSKFTIEHPAAVAPMQRFVAVRDDTSACLLLSDGLPEYELLLDGHGTLALTLLRCVGLLAGEDLITRPGGKAGWHNTTPEAQCPGLHTFRYAFVSLRADEWKSYRHVDDECERFHYPFLPIRRKNPDPLPMEASFLSVPGGQLTLSACKEAEDGDGVVVRLNNPTEREVEETVVFVRPPARVAETRLDETVIRPQELAGGREIRVRVGPSGILTLKAWFNA